VGAAAAARLGGGGRSGEHPDPGSYRAFIAGSCGELSPAKHIYAALRTGWFSTCSVCYLAAGRPVIVQQKGFPGQLSAGEGVLPFESAEQAAASVLEVECDYRRHANAAHEIAQEYFSADRVLARFLKGATSP
jgi:hypothetical protein